MENIGIKIKYIRDKYQLSQDRFGKKLGLSGKTISAYETNKASPPLHIINKIERVYKVSLFSIPSDQKDLIVDTLDLMNKSINELKSFLIEGLSL